MVATLNSFQPHAGGYLVSEAEFDRSRDQITVVSGAVTKAGTVLGKVTASGKYTPLSLTGTTGAEIPVAISFDAYDASAGDVKGAAHTRDCQVNQKELIWPAGASGGQITAGEAGLASVGIIVRPAI